MRNKTLTFRHTSSHLLLLPSCSRPSRASRSCFRSSFSSVMLRFSFSSALSTLPVLKEVVTSVGPSVVFVFALTLASPFEYVLAKGAAEDGGSVPFAAGNVAVLYAGELRARVRNAGDVGELLLDPWRE